jgi:hypothetical protein
MGVVIAIVASRVSETQLPIKVSISDFWGAVTVGFVAYFVGDRILKKLTDFATAGTQTSDTARPKRVEPEAEKK